MDGLAIIQARMGSHRFEGKSLMPLGSGTVISACFNAVLSSNCFSDIVVATTTKDEDDILVDYLIQEDIDYFRGSEKNVFSRFFELSKIKKPHFVARLTGDNPLIDPIVINTVVEAHLESKADYTSNVIERTWPRGNDIECINTDILFELNNKNLNKDELEHVTLFIRKNLDFYKINSVVNNKELKFPNLRITLDYKDDYELIKIIYEDLSKKNLEVNADNIDKLITQNPEYLNINENSNHNTINGIEY